MEFKVTDLHYSEFIINVTDCSKEEFEAFKSAVNQTLNKKKVILWLHNGV